MALIKSMPGNVSLESMLREICKLTAIRALGLPVLRRPGGLGRRWSRSRISGGGHRRRRW
ncbi:MAG: hypothetical protein ACRDP6_01245 [Actinoallomurus sp.]